MHQLKKIKTLAKAIGIERPLSVTLRQAKRYYEWVDEAYKKVKKNALVLRMDFLWEHTRDGSLLEEQWKATQQLLMAERVKESNHWKKSVTKLNRAGSTRNIEVDSDDGVIEVSDKDGVEKAIMDMCAECFHLTESTPLLQDPLLSDLGYLAKLEEAQAVLHGTYECSDEVDKFTRDFLTCLKVNQDIPTRDKVNISITKEDFQAHWKYSKEGISSSVSG